MFGPFSWIHDGLQARIQMFSKIILGMLPRILIEKKLDIETLRKLDIDSIIQWGLLKLLDIEKTKNMATRKFLRDLFNDVQQRLIG